MKNKENIVLILTSRNANGAKPHRNMMKSLLKSPVRRYDLSWSDTVHNGVTYDGNLYMNKYTRYFKGCYCKGKPHILQTDIALTLPQSMDYSGRFIRDTLLYDSSITKMDDVVGLNRGDYNTCLFLLTTNSHILQYELHRSSRWRLKTCVYLGLTQFSHLNYDCQGENFVAKSTRQRGGDVYYIFALFKTAPFQFICAFEISKSIFGDIKDAYVTNGVVVILTKASYSFYSLNDVIANFLIHSGNFHDKVDKSLGIGSLGGLSEISTWRIGEYSYGLPLNLKITEKPVCMFEIPAKDAGGLSFGGFPWYCLATYGEYIKLYDVRSGQVVAMLDFGKFTYRCNLDDEKKAYFHPDRSGRLLCVEYDSIKCLEICEKNEAIEIVPCYTISYGERLNAKPIQRRSRSGRKYKPIKHSNDVTSLPSEIVHSLDYDDDLKMMCVLFTHITGTSEMNSYMVAFYENDSGDEIRRLKLSIPVCEKDDHEWNLFFDDLLVVCTLKMIAYRGKTVVYMYQMFESCCTPETV